MSTAGSLLLSQRFFYPFVAAIMIHIVRVLPIYWQVDIIGDYFVDLSVLAFS